MARRRADARIILGAILGTLAVAGLTAVGCGGDDTTSSGGPDAAPDTSVVDSGTHADSTAADTGTADTGAADTGTADTGTADSGTADTGTADTGITDTGVADTGKADTGVADTGTADTGVADTGVADTGVVTPPDGGPASDGGVCTQNWPDGGTNLLTNPTFEPGLTGWSASFGGTASVSTAQAFCGTQSGEISARTAQYQALFASFTTTPGIYNVAVWVLQDGTTSQGITVGGDCAQADGGTAFPAGPSATVAPNTWTEITGTITVPAGCSTMSVFVGQPGSAVSPFPDIFVDEAFVGD